MRFLQHGAVFRFGSCRPVCNSLYKMRVDLFLRAPVELYRPNLRYGARDDFGLPSITIFKLKEASCYFGYTADGVYKAGVSSV